MYIKSKLSVKGKQTLAFLKNFPIVPKVGVDNFNFKNHFQIFNSCTREFDDDDLAWCSTKRDPEENNCHKKWKALHSKYYEMRHEE